MKRYLIILLNLILIYKINSFNRIVSISPAVTEVLYILKADDKLIANTIYCERPQEAKLKDKIGNIVDINVEKIIALKPDVIITTTMTKKDKIDKLIKIGLKVEVFYEPKNYNEICEQFIRVASFVDKVEYAKKIIEYSKEELNIIKDKLKNQREKKVFVEIGKDPLFTISKESYINDIINFSKAKNIADDTNIGFYSREKVLEKNPDAIIVVDMGLDTEKEILDWSRYKSLAAVKNKKIKSVDAYLVCSSNPKTFVYAVKEFVKILHSIDF